MMGVATRVVGPLLIGLSLVACGAEQSSQWAATISTADVGTCRGAFEHEAEAPATEWISFAEHLPTQLDAVFTARAIEDHGERDIYTREDGEGIDLPKLGRFTGISTLAGRVDEPVEVLMSPFAVDDAAVTVAAVGAELLVWLPPQPEDRRFASLAALKPDGAAVFLGNCIPAWTPAFDRYVERHGQGLTGAELLTRLLVDPNGPEATAFRSSEEAATPAGPTDS
jgi:hypothetical protein